MRFGIIYGTYLLRYLNSGFCRFPNTKAFIKDRPTIFLLRFINPHQLDIVSTVTLKKLAIVFDKIDNLLIATSLHY
jgi:hypothetical protein